MKGKRIVSLMLAGVMACSGFVSHAAALPDNAGESGAPDVRLQSCQEELADIRLEEETQDVRLQQDKAVLALRQCQEALESDGYESYIVDESNIGEIGELTGSDFESMGLRDGGTYLVVYHSDGENPGARTSVTSPGTYTYNGKTYSYRYCTITAADSSRYAQASDCDLLTTTSSTLIQNCLDTAINAYVSSVSTALGTVASICGLSISDFAPNKSATFRMNCGSNWTRTYTEIYSDYDSAWEAGTCVEYVQMYSYFSGTYYDKTTNKMKAIPTGESRKTKYSSKYNDTTWRKEKAVIAVLNGNGCNYNTTGAVEYYYGGTKKITHYENF